MHVLYAILLNLLWLLAGVSIVSVSVTVAWLLTDRGLDVAERAIASWKNRRSAQ